MNSDPVTPPERVKVLYLITGLGVGGAERMLYTLLSRMDRDLFEFEVGSLVPAGKIGEKIRAIGIPVWTLGMKRGFPSPWKLSRLTNELRRSSPHILHTWMYHADLMGALAVRRVGKVPLVWGIRNGSLDRGSTRITTIATARICARLSGSLPDGILYCSHASRESHRRFGYHGKREAVIPNGFDVEHFLPDPGARAAVRRELGLTEDDFLIGLIGRFDKVKDHETFFRAAARLTDRYPNVHFLLCGKGVDSTNARLMNWVREAQLEPKTHLLGLRADITRLVAALDVATNCSRGEAFSLVVGEAMSCGVPCVVTDVGDSARIVNETGFVVPPRDPASLSDAWARMIELGNDNRAKLGALARRRVIDNYRIDKTVALYQDFYRSTLDGK